MADFTHIQHWIFDLDNTLYPAECHLFSQIDARMTRFVQQHLGLDHGPARVLQKDYYVRYGTTLAGLMKEHNIAPQAFMDYVHDIDLAALTPCPELKAGLGRLPGKKYIFTNGSVKHAENVAAKIGVLDLFDGIFDIAQAGYVPKPETITYEKFLQHFSVKAGNAAMFEDLPQNLLAAHQLGLKTVLVQSEATWFADEPAEKRPSRPGESFDHVHHVTDHLPTFLHQLETAIAA